MMYILVSKKTGIFSSQLTISLMNGIVKKCAVGEYPKSEIDRYQAA